MRESAFTDPRIVDLRANTELLPDDSQKTFDGAGLEVEFTDGSTESVFIPNFRGTPGNPMSDDELSQVFRLSAAETLDSAKTRAVLDAAWSLKSAPDIRPFMALLSCG
jgi:2-methylcitrate dehydratase PrpD